MHCLNCTINCLKKIGDYLSIIDAANSNCLFYFILFYFILFQKIIFFNHKYVFNVAITNFIKPIHWKLNNA